MLTEHIVKIGGIIYCSVSYNGTRIVTEPVVLFRNQMSLKNWAYIAMAFALAVPFMVFDGTDVGLAVTIAAGLAVAACAFAIALIAWMGRRNIGVLRQVNDQLEAEMLSPWGNGRRRLIPLAEIEDWRLTRLWPTLRFRHGRSDYSLPLHGALIDWPAIREIAPDIRDIER